MGITKGTETQIIEVQDEDRYKKANIIISSIYKCTLLESRLYAIAFNQINNAMEDKEGSLIVTLKVPEIIDKLDLKGRSLYGTLKKTAAKMTSGLSIGLTDPVTGGFTFVPFVTKAAYLSGEFIIRFPPEMKPFLKDVEKHYTMLSLNTILSFESVYSLKLYELLKSKSYAPKNVKTTNDTIYLIEISLAELKLELGVVNSALQKVRNVLINTGEDGKPDYEMAVKKADERMYESYSEFRRYVLDKSIKEINEKTEMNIDYSPIKAGRGGRAVAVSFKVILNTVKNGVTKDNQAKDHSVPDNIDDLIDKVREISGKNIKTSESRNILKLAGYDIQKVADADTYVKTKKYDNYVSYMIKTLENNWNSNEIVVDRYNKNPSNIVNIKHLDDDKILDYTNTMTKIDIVNKMI